jgi:uncharacterized Fe-S cluster-containing radical SAM superfamily protein
MNPVTSDFDSSLRLAKPVDPVPQAELGHLETLWFQVTGTICNLRCSHCFISCSPDNHTLELMSRAQVKDYLAEALEIGVKEIYFTGGEPFLHPEIFEILEDALAVAPTTVLSNGVLITERFARRLGELAAASEYSLEIRVSLDAPDEEVNDAIRGAGVFGRALRGLLRLERAGLLPIVTATELVVEEGRIHARPGDDSFYRKFHDLLARHGLRPARVKILPVFNMGMLDGRGTSTLVTRGMLAGFDTRELQCSSGRLVAHDGVYACPILAGESGARMSESGLSEALRPCSLYHPSCATCLITGMTCRNF